MRSQLQKRTEHHPIATRVDDSGISKTDIGNKIMSWSSITRNMTFQVKANIECGLMVNYDTNPALEPCWRICRRLLRSAVSVRYRDLSLFGPSFHAGNNSNKK
jgi:hypothetical protein